MRLIDADELKEEFVVLSYEAFNVSYIMEVIDEQPTIDAEPVVRCKDCRYYTKGAPLSPHSGWCEHLERAKFDEHYCSYGDRR